MQTSYGRALIWGKGYAAPETAAAYARARDLGANAGEATANFETYYGQWAGGFMRGDFASCRDIAAAFVHDAEGAARMPEIAVAHRVLGLMLHLQGDFVDARSHFLDALRVYDPRWDYDTKTHLGPDTGANATANLARVNWVLGELGQTRELMDDALARAVESGDIPTLANIQYFKALFELNRGHTEAARHDADQILQLGRQHELPTYLAFGRILHGYARACLGDRDTGIVELREGLTAHTEQGNRAWVPYYQGLLAKLEGDGRDFEGALRRIEEALELAGVTSEHENDAPLHQIRGEVLLKRDPTNAAPAEEAFLTAIAIAQQQKARSFELRAAHSLAKLYQSTGRSADAHAVLAPALEGFSPTPEFPEISEAQVLLEVLAHTDEVKNATASRQRRLQLQTSYGQAMMWAKGYGAEETKAAFARARDFAANIGNFAERSAANYGHWANSHMRGEFNLARETAEIFLHEAMNEGRMPEASIAQRMLGFTSLFQGKFTKSRAHLEEALRIYDPGWNNDNKFRLSVEPGLAAMAYLAEVEWALGYVGRSRDLIDELVARSIEAAHVPTLANSYNVGAEHEMFRGEVDAAMEAGKVAFEYSREHQLGHYMPMATIFSGWARARLRQSRGQSAGNASSPRRSYRTRKPGPGADLPGSPC